MLEGIGLSQGGLVAFAVVPLGVVLIRVETYILEPRRARTPRVRRPENVIARGRAKLVSEDDFGRLWEAGRDDQRERIRVVEVVNATPEADGSSRHHFLRVPPSARTAHEAVAWTFGLAAAEYMPVRES